jgi:hypothetical protein
VIPAPPDSRPRKDSAIPSGSYSHHGCLQPLSSPLDQPRTPLRRTHAHPSIHRSTITIFVSLLLLVEPVWRVKDSNLGRRKPTDLQVVDRCCGRGTSGLAVCAVVPRARDQLAMPGQDRGGSDRKGFLPRGDVARAEIRRPATPGRRACHKPGDLPAPHGVVVP